ncbi:Reticulocyte-binding protein 2 a [Phytophthora citrophthora]|uniref:Reticulocyte-binding protein 2 a n=1 Tax=Phytophthora citrophthora TaxID=4793 RepID=A0AAD9LCM1_9STRA|nr:Reticulocyte-binding protein 2 a [Phytophthora citrophthora]
MQPHTETSFETPFLQFHRKKTNSGQSAISTRTGGRSLGGPMLGTQAPGAGNWGNSFGPRTDMDSVPLFEREHRNDSQLVQRLQNELADAKRFVEAQARRQNDLEYVNEDLERRLEQEALDRITLDAQKAEDEKRWQQEKAALQEQLKSWEARFEEETRRRSMAEERLRRAEKELYRMHQKKYDIEKQVRREESEKRKHEAVIVRSLQSDSQRAQQNAANGFLDPTVNPKDAKPATVRTRQALSSAMDFLGV